MRDFHSLTELITSHLASTGPLPFPWFMEQALYHPQFGYYASGKSAIGRHGDFFTNVSVGALFGKMLATQFREMWERMGKPARFTIVEQGAHRAEFARDVLDSLRGSEFFDAVDYIVVEPFELLREAQQETLAPYSNVSWSPSLEALEPFSGVHFSNELLDAMPVHLVRFAEGAWRERYVTAQFELIDGPLSNPALESALAHAPRIDGYETEVNLAARGWISELAQKLSSGWILAFDYGYPREVFYNPERNRGTLACYSGHRRSDNPFHNIGATDITAHVEFTSIAERAIECGLNVAGFTDQHHFMVGLGREEFADADSPLTPDQQKHLRAFRTLMHPSLMGLSFKVFALEKNGMHKEPLRGFQFAGNPKSLLGL